MGPLVSGMCWFAACMLALELAPLSLSLSWELWSCSFPCCFRITCFREQLGLFRSLCFGMGWKFTDRKNVCAVTRINKGLVFRFSPKSQSLLVKSYGRIMTGSWLRRPSAAVLFCCTGKTLQTVRDRFAFFRCCCSSLYQLPVCGWHSTSRRTRVCK